MKILQKIKASFTFVQFVITVSAVLFLMLIFKKHNRKIRQSWARLQKYLLNYELEVIGEADKEAKMVILNHQSFLDIILLEAIYPNDLAWVAKKEIENITFFGNIMRLSKMISIDREDKKSLMQLFADCKDRVEAGRTIAIFPEGTRGDGKNMMEFKGGAKLIASKLKTKVQPIVVVNTKNVLDSKNFKAKSGKVKLIYLKSIDITKDKNWFKQMQIDMQETLDKEQIIQN